MTQPTDLTERYGAPRPGRRRALAAACVVVAAAFLGWLGWTIWEQSTPQVRSTLVGYEVAGEHAATATIEVRLADGSVRASCTLRAYAEDHTVVGELAFRPTEGRNAARVRTERRATSVELVGCTAPGQNRPR